MKIVNNTDVNNLILFSKRNLGLYKLLYREYKFIYWFSIFCQCVSALFLILYFYSIIFPSNLILERVYSIICAIMCINSLFLLKLLTKKTNKKHLKVQEKRYKILKEYYNRNDYYLDDIKNINKLLNKRIEKIEKQKITILVIVASLALSVWDLIIENYFKIFSVKNLISTFVLIIIISLFILILVKFFNRMIYLYEENMYIKNNVSLIENLVYLNDYIIFEKEALIKNGRGRRNC